MSNLKAKPDAIIIASTTLKVLGAKRIVREIYRLVKNQVDGVTI